MHLLPLRPAVRVPALARGYAQRMPKHVNEKSAAIRDVVYDDKVYQHLISDEERLDNLQQVIPSPEVHDTIRRARQLVLRQRRETQAANLQARYQSLQSALSLLKETDNRLFELATKPRFSNARGTGDLPKDRELSRQGRLPNLFPRQLWIPTRRSGTKTWDHDWKRPEEKKNDSSESTQSTS